MSSGYLWLKKMLIMWKKTVLLVIAVIITLFCCFVFTIQSSPLTPAVKRSHSQQIYQKPWPISQLSWPYNYSYRWLETNCLKIKTPTSLETLINILEQWSVTPNAECKDLYKLFSGILTITEEVTDVVIPKTFAVKLLDLLKSNELMKEVYHQSIIFAYNEYTREQNTFNPLRNKRPLAKPDKPERVYVEEISNDSAKSCDFCNYTKFTSEDVFGRIESKHSYTAANTFKIDRWHSLALTRSHHPHNWTEEEFFDLMQTANMWFRKVNKINPLYKYPMIVWDLLPHAGASQIHPHIHIFIDKNGYQGGVENWRRSADQYTVDKPGRNYFSDLVTAHSLLGLTTRYGSAVAMANLVPKKDNEIVIMSDNPGSDFFKLLYITLREYIDGMDKLCFSVGIALPSLDATDFSGRIPAFARAVTRGAVADVRSDVSSFELFTSSNVNDDPFKLIRNIEKAKARV